MHEKELFKQIEKNPKFLTCKDIIRTLTKVWSGYTKLIRSLLSSYKTAVSYEFGKFAPTAQGAQFTPNPYFLSSTSYTLKPTPPPPSSPEQPLSYSSISLASGYPKELCQQCIKEIISACVSLSKSSEITLDFKVGHLTFKSSEYFFTSNSKPKSSGPAIIDNVNIANPNDIGHFPNSANRIKSVPPNPANIPWPYLSGFYDDSNKRLGKRYNFEENLTPSQLLDDHKRQIVFKNHKNLTSLKEDARNGQILANLANNQMVEDRENKSFKVKVLQDIFMTGNNSQIEEHKMKNVEKKTQKMNEKYDFFPFVYGSKLEEFQLKLKEKMNEEMKVKMENDRKEFRTRQGMPDSYTTALPAFMKQDKTEPKRRVENTHVKAAMAQALNRYEDELNSLKVSKKIEENREKDKEKTTKLHEERGKNFKEHAITDNKNFILQQIEENKARKLEEKKRQEIFTKNHFGPEESPERVQIETEKISTQKKNLKEDLIKQMIEKKEKSEDKKLREMQNEELNAFALIKDWEKDEFKKELKMQAMKNINREVWKKQMEMKSLEKNLSK